MERIKKGLIRSALTAFLPLLITPDINGQVTSPVEGPEVRGVNKEISILANCASHGGEEHLDLTVKGPPRINWITHLRRGEEGFWIKFTDDSGTAVLGGYSVFPDNLSTMFHGRVRSLRDEGIIPFESGREYSVEVFQHPYTRGIPDLSRLYDRVTFKVPFSCVQ